MKGIVEITDRPDVRTLLESLVGIGPNALPVDEISLRATLIAETLRIGLFDLYHRTEPGRPVHPLSLRSWVRHKLGSVVPDVLNEGESSFREVLCEGRGANLEFLGDSLILSDGYLCPAPTRLVQVSPGSYLLISGVPSESIGPIAGHLIHSALGRRVEGIAPEEVAASRIPVQRLEEYLGKPGGVPSPATLFGSFLSRSRSPWQPGRGWEVYAGNLEIGASRTGAIYGFSWIDPKEARGRRSAQANFQGGRMSVWKEPLTERFYHYWLSVTMGDSSFGVTIPNIEWKQACIALDSLAGSPREATFVRNPRGSGVLLSLGFQPFEALYRALHALDARFERWRQGVAEWVLPIHGMEAVKGLLERVGVRVRVLGT
jgi:hypothetical protein